MQVQRQTFQKETATYTPKNTVYESAVKCLDHIAYHVGTRLGHYCHWGHLGTSIPASVYYLLIIIYVFRYNFTLYLVFYCYRNASAFSARLLSASFANISGLLPCLAKLNKGVGLHKKGQEIFNRRR